MSYRCRKVMHLCYEEAVASVTITLGQLDSVAVEQLLLRVSLTVSRELKGSIVLARLRSDGKAVGV